MDKKFDVVIGNPPYGEEAAGSGTRETPIYHLFMDAAYEVADKVVMITPARFLFNAGFTPKAWNQRMLADPHLSVSHYAPNSDSLFPGTDIKAGIAVTYRDASSQGDPVGTFTRHPQLNEILRKVRTSNEPSIEPLITSSRSYRYTPALYEVYPDLIALRPQGNQALISTNTFAQFDSVLRPSRPEDAQSYARILGLSGRDREYRWIRSDFVTGPDAFNAHKVAVAKATGSGVLGEALASPLVIGPQTAVTQSFITIGAFDTDTAAEACLAYVKSKFARALLGVLKVTQDNPAKVWHHVPLQDFTPSSDIDWTKPIPEIDQQLYAKYGLEADEIAFIEDKVKPME